MWLVLGKFQKHKDSNMAKEIPHLDFIHQLDKPFYSWKFVNCRLLDGLEQRCDLLQVRWVLLSGLLALYAVLLVRLEQ